jgi:hypothetical protein
MFPLCRNCGQILAVARGQCETCYQQSRAAVRAGAATWAELEAAGLALPKRPPGPYLAFRLFALFGCTGMAAMGLVMLGEAGPKHQGYGAAFVFLGVFYLLILAGETVYYHMRQRARRGRGQGRPPGA